MGNANSATIQKSNLATEIDKIASNYILALNYNYKPAIKNKGSAIFIHIASQNYKNTRGCIALKKSDLILILEKIKKSTIVKIQ